MPKYLQSDDFLRDFAHGDRRAFGALFDYFFTRLTVFGAKVTKDYHVGEDAASESLAKLMLAHADWRYGSFTVDRLAAYLFMAVRNKCINYLASFRKKTAPTGFDATEALAEAQVESAEEGMFYAEVVARLYESLDELSKERRRALELLFYQEKSYEAAAKAMGVPLSTFKYIRKGGLFQMAKKLTQKEMVISVALTLAFATKFFISHLVALFELY